VWFIENHEDVSSVTERIARERRDETVLKQKAQSARNKSRCSRRIVMAGLVPAIHVFLLESPKEWMTGTIGA